MVRRGDIYFCNLGSGVGSEQTGIRPVLVLQNDIGNTYSPTTIIASLTTKFTKSKMPTHVCIGKCDTVEHSIKFNSSMILLEQIRTVDKTRLLERVARLKSSAMERVDSALEVSIFHKKIDKKEMIDNIQAVERIHRGKQFKN